MSLLWDLGFRQSLLSHSQGCCLRPQNPSCASVFPPQSREDACVPEEPGMDHSGQPRTDATVRYDVRKDISKYHTPKGFIHILTQQSTSALKDRSGEPCLSPA